MKEHLFFPSLRFFKVKSIDKQSNYGARKTKYYWIGHPHQFEYREILKVTPYCNFKFEDFPFDEHECDLNFGSDALSKILVLNWKDPTSTMGKNIVTIKHHASELF